MNDFLIKNFSENCIEKEMVSIGFDVDYLKKATEKYKSKLFKIYALSPVQATILKQTALSCGTDCAVHRDVLIQNIEKSDVILFGSVSQIKKIAQKLYAQPFGLKILAKNLEERIQQISIVQKTQLMGILNITPNSFSDGGEFFEKEKAIEKYSQMIADGADIIDIGAESTAPNAVSVTVEEEIFRIEKILPELRKINSIIPISIDTRNAKTAQKALGMGANIINDVSGLNYDKNMIDVVSDSAAKIVLTFDEIIKTQNVMDEVILGLLKKAELCLNRGILKDRIILDVGLGFNKTFEQNIELIKRAEEICSLGFFVLYGISRKSFIQKMTDLPAKETFEANISINSYLASCGVNILRVHDIKAHKIAIGALDKVLYDKL